MKAPDLESGDDESFISEAQVCRESAEVFHQFAEHWRRKLELSRQVCDDITETTL